MGVGPTTHVVLLRGVNVGGHNRVAMAELRRVLAAAGFGEVRTYVQSGNAVLTADTDDPAVVAGEVATLLAGQLGVHAAVLARTETELRAVVDRNPFVEAAAADPTTVHAVFLDGEPSSPDAFDVDAAAFAPEELSHGDRVLYLHLPGGLGRSALATELGRRRSEVQATMRNWRTVTRLLELAGGTPDA